MTVTEKKESKSVVVLIAVLFYASAVRLLFVVGKYFMSGMTETGGLFSSFALFVIFGLFYGTRVKRWPFLVRLGSHEYSRNRYLVSIIIAIVLGRILFSAYQEEWPTNILFLGLAILIIAAVIFIRYYKRIKKYDEMRAAMSTKADGEGE